MLQRDYLLDMIDTFVDVVKRGIERAKVGEIDATGDIEAEVAKLLALDPQTALSLAPASLVTMMDLAGVGDACAGYVAYALNQLADIYNADGQCDLASLRREQAYAIAAAFAADVNEPPEEFFA